MFSKNDHISNFMKIRPVGAELFNTNGRTGMTKVTVTFRNFVKALKKTELFNCHDVGFIPAAKES